MPRYIVKETRARAAEYLIEATDERAARHLNGDILDEGGDADDYSLSFEGCEQVDDDRETL